MKLKFLKSISVFLAINILTEICFPTVAYALSGGPSQPEVQSFDPAGATEMVDLFSGDFSYNIPLIDIEGYPINLSYHSGITMDQEASWVGLGWNINPGAITREMRGLPDEFSGDLVTREQYIKHNETFGADIGAGVGAGTEIFGVGSVNVGFTAGIGVFYNNYKGIGFQKIRNRMLGGALLMFGAQIGESEVSNTQSGTTNTLNKGWGVGVTTGKLLGDKRSLGIGYNSNQATTTNSRSGIKSTSSSSGFQLKFSDQKVGLNGKVGLMSSGSISYNHQSYIPQIQTPLNGYAFMCRLTAGGEFFGVNPNMFINGYYSRQSITTPTSGYKVAGYGYLNTHKAYTIGGALLDVNREKDGAFTTNKPNLALANHTFDIYNISGQGISGMFRSHRNDIGVLRDNFVSSRRSPDEDDDLNISLELGLGNLVHVGADVTFTDPYQQSGMWSNALTNSFGPLKQDSINKPLYEPCYYKVVGEKNEVSTTLLSYQNLNQPVAPILNGTSVLGNELRSGGNGEHQIFTAQQVAETTRSKRSQNISTLKASDSVFCFSRSIESYQMNLFGSSSKVTKTLRTDGIPKHHTTEMTVLNATGERYIYGIPAYNNLQEEYTFTCGDGGSLATGVVDYDPNILNNKRGVEDGIRDGYFDATKLPAYAHSYLLTSVLSDDYVDVNQNGPDESDMGHYTKINYTKVQQSYKWRIPYAENAATFQPGDMSNPYDDKAIILYGEKQLWYVHSIESKNYVAEFTIRKREDARGVHDKNGGIGTEAMYLLDKITLYTKAEKAKGPGAVPIKTVYFEYDYSLCPGVENNTGLAVDKGGIPISGGGLSPLNVNANAGKLTLRKIYFTYGKSEKSRFNTYVFKYTSDDDSKYNEVYNRKGNDRWGHFKKSSTGITNSEFPYVDQSEASQTYAQQWTLNQIELPSGGIIKVEYEADDYAYVQNRRAMQMFKIKGFGALKTSEPVNELYNRQNGTSNNYMFVELEDATMSEAQIKKEFFKDISQLYFSCMVAMGNNTHYESIRGYVNISSASVGLVPGDNRLIWIKMEGVGFDTEKSGVNPISKATWQYARLNAEYLVYPESNPKMSNMSAGAVFRSLVGFSADRRDNDINRYLFTKDFGRVVDLNKSFVRLNNPDMKKLGGGVRVKKLTMSDNWNSMSSGSGISTEYGQEYEYTTQEGERVISSGVASYEPMVGNDENPFRKPVGYNQENYLIPDDQFYVEEPFGEMFFPGAMVGYSKVTVRNLRYENVKNHSTGKVEYTFYTAKDFPTITKHLGVDVYAPDPSISSTLFSSTMQGSTAVTAGYMIELNDMHGKQRATWVYAAQDPNDPNGIEKLISGMEYIYKTNPNNPKQLDNMVKVVQSDGSLSEKLVGVDVDFNADSRMEEASSSMSGYQGNLDVFTFGFIPFPIPVPTVFPTDENSDISFRSMSITKVVQRYGIVEKTIAYDNGATLSTSNLAFDAETGQVLITSVQTEYDQSVFHTTYPAHWVYAGLKGAYWNQDAVVGGVQISPAGTISLTGSRLMKDYFCNGDEICLVGNNNRYWIGYSELSSYQWKLYAKNESVSLPTEGTYVAKIVRSGSKNMLGASVQQVSTLSNPVTDNKIEINTDKRVLNANSLEYESKWKQPCNILPTSVTVYRGKEKQREIIQIVNYLLTSGQCSSTMNRPDTCSALWSAEKTINDTFTGHLAYDTSSLYSRRIATGTTHTFRENLYKQCDGSGSINFNLEFPLSGSSNGGVYIYLKDTGCVKNSISKRPSAIEYLGVPMNTLSSNLSLFSGLIPIKVYFDSGCSVMATALLENLPQYDTSFTVNKCVVSEPDPPTNPFLAATDGYWKPVRSYVYNDDRTTASTTSDIRKDGYYKSFDPFWKNTSGYWEGSNASGRWIQSNEVTNYNTYTGESMENKDALNKYSTSLYLNELNSSGQHLPVASAQNAKMSQIGFESFENYDWGPVDDYSGTCPIGHWNFFQSDELNVDTVEFHSGKHSLKLSTSQSAWTENGVADNCGSYCPSCVYPFYPDAGKYWISAWVKTATTKSDATNRKGYILVSYGDLNYDMLKPSGPIIEGWQRIEGTIQIPAGAASIKVMLKPDSANITWFDDIRVQPFNSSMKTFVYDKFQHRLMAEQDENNYTIFYEYDEQHALKRVKRETAKGIVTIKETRTSTIKR